MSRFFGSVCSLLLLLSMAAHAAAQGEIVVIPLKGEVSQAQFFFLRRALKTAEREKASAVILDMETYGGEVFAAIDIMDALMKSDVPTYTLVDNKAISAGALIAVATQKIYMTSTAVIGASAPVSSGGEDLPSTMKDKTVSAISAIVRAASQKNDHNAELVEAFINKEKEIKIGDTVINAKGSLLTLSAQEASRVFNGKPLLAAGIADSIDDLIKKEKLKGHVRTFELTGFEKLAPLIAALGPLFLLAGILCSYLEVKLHGTFIPGIIAVTCFGFFFGGNYIAGLAGWEVFACFIIGFMLVISEIMLHPGTILPGLAGLFLMIGSILWAMVDRYPDQPWLPSGEMLKMPFLNLAAILLASIVIILLFGRFLPKTTFYNRLVLGTSGPAGPSLSNTSIDSPSLVKTGETGVAKSILRPSGKAMFGDNMLDVVTDGGFVESGSRIRVVAIEGVRIVVEGC